MRDFITGSFGLLGLFKKYSYFISSPEKKNYAHSHFLHSNFILTTSDCKRRGAFLIDLIHPVATVSLVYRLLTYEKRIGNEGTNFT